MHDSSLFARKKRSFKCTTDSRTTKRIAPNVLARSFTADAPNRKWVTDVKAIRTSEGWMDVLGRRDRSVFTTRCWTCDEREQRHQSCHTSTQQCEVCSWSHQWTLASFGSRIARSKRHRQRATRFVSHAPLGRSSFATHSQARRVVSEYIDQFFNPIRRHSTNGYFSPIEVELRWQSGQFTVESMCPQNSGKLTRWSTTSARSLRRILLPSM